jgi:hypothetical protein
MGVWQFSDFLTLTLSTLSISMESPMFKFRPITYVRQLYLGQSICQKGCFLQNSSQITANSADPDETARFEPAYLDLHCLHIWPL